ncbi:type II toxin-antitoxin system RelE/ParE family toxin [Caulobacter vibrioides]|uniref:Type II toxin-antitoxin system RelE/ParE family toxin n=1 Tax=Caulobacter vibrioides TaxID=155892 RepID=A0A290MM24_CAUVI|nr:type II toxin-antitoxin system RelE/ParE family toxin [Caulobacter vibrioides]ATC33127.1 type II toxin-antitoxin system RelE/ParE family toxin [Caulobacter vibrioides]
MRAIVYAPEAVDDLRDLYDYIAGHGAPNAALAYVTRLDERCAGLADFPEQGVRRDDIRPNLRLLGFERRTMIAFFVTADAVVIIRILHGGQDVGLALGE